MFINYQKKAFLLLTQQNLKFQRTNILIKDMKIVIRFFSNFIRMIVQYCPIPYIKIRVPFRAIFKDSSQKNPLPYLKIADILNIKQDNKNNNQALFLNMYQIYLL